MSKPWPGPVSAHWGEPGDATSPWRLVLRCRWGEGKPLVVVGMNPSTASEAEPDPTCQRWLSMAQRWGYAALTVVNLFPLRATSPKDMERGVFAIEGHLPRQVGRHAPMRCVRPDLRCTPGHGWDVNTHLHPAHGAAMVGA